MYKQENAIQNLTLLQQSICYIAVPKLSSLLISNTHMEVATCFVL